MAEIHHPSCPTRHDRDAVCDCPASNPRPRTSTDMLLDVTTHADQAFIDRFGSDNR